MPPVAELHMQDTHDGAGAARGSVWQAGFWPVLKKCFLKTKL